MPSDHNRFAYGFLLRRKRSFRTSFAPPWQNSTMCGVSNYVAKLRTDVLSAENLERIGHIFDFATLPVRFQGRYIRRAFLSTTSSSRHAVCIRPSCSPLPVASYLVLSRGTRCASAPPFKRLMPLCPRGPRSGPGYSVPVHHHLTGPMRPTHRHSSISPHSGLYGLPSLCTLFPCLGDPRVVPCFRWPAISTCRPLRPREAHRLRSSSSFTDGAGLRLEVKVSALPTSPPSDSRGGQYFGA